jgi:hypothetical protein
MTVIELAESRKWSEHQKMQRRREHYAAMGPNFPRAIRGMIDTMLHIIAKDPGREAGQEGEDPMKESTLSKITAAGAIAKGMAQKALAASPNPQWTEYEMQSVDEWIARQDVKLDRPEAIRRLVEIGLKAKGK